MLHYHLTVLLLNLVSFFSFFVLLIPAPFVDLGFCESTCLTNSLACVFAPTWIFVVFLHKVLHLVGVFSISFLFVSLYRDFLSKIMFVSWHYFRNFWCCVERPALEIHISVGNALLVGTELSYLLKRINEQNLWNYLPFSVFVSSCVMRKIFIFI